MRFAKRTAASGVMILLCATMALAKPNFSGRWKMNPARSDFGEVPTPTSLEQQVTHNDPDLKVITNQAGEMGEFTHEYSYTTDGKECVNKFRNIDRKSTARWEGDTLVIESKMNVEGNAVTVLERWSLSEDGKFLTNHRVLKGPEGETKLKTVFEKQ
jgi:hypothetical protein